MWTEKIITYRHTDQVAGAAQSVSDYLNSLTGNIADTAFITTLYPGTVLIIHYAPVVDKPPQTTLRKDKQK